MCILSCLSHPSVQSRMPSCDWSVSINHCILCNISAFFGSKSLGFLRIPWMKCWSETFTQPVWVLHVFLGWRYVRVAVVTLSISPLKTQSVLLQYLKSVLSETPPFWYKRSPVWLLAWQDIATRFCNVPLLCLNFLWRSGNINIFLRLR